MTRNISTFARDRKALRMSRIGLAVAFIGLFLCGAAPQQRTVKVFAASSLTNALQDIDAAFSKSTGIAILPRFGATSALAHQLERSSFAAVFISADERWMDYAETYCHMEPSSRVDLLSNQLVLIAPKSSPIDTVVIAKGFDLAALAGDGHIAVADVNEVPGDIYAKRALISLGAWAAVAPKLMNVENVRTALALVAQEYVSAGIVYETDAKVEPGVKIIGTFPESADSQIKYSAAATITSDQDTLNYLHFLRSLEAKTIFERYGFRYLD
jgi:molybdate transport system substrate-binding protein